MMWQSGEHKKVTKLYELKKTLGRGHFAVVKLAHHLLTGEKVAIKVIDKTKLDKVSADHLYHEVTCMKLVQHPNVVRLYQVIETETKLYLILELGDGGDMFDYIMRHDKGLKECHAKEYFSQILSAIVYCHKLHVVHRDLKPENVVFFESQGLVKLTDFGFSNHYQPGEKLSTSCGSLAYSAPEILLGEEYDAPAVDVWSLGVILYMLVCGVAPFNEANDSETLTNIMDCRYTILDHVSDDCKDLISRMIIRDPGERMSLDEIMKHDWLQDVESLHDLPQPIFTKDDVISKELHEEIIEIMTRDKMAAAEEEILEAIKEDRYDHITSTYYLLAERSLTDQREAAREEEEAADLCAAGDCSQQLPPNCGLVSRAAMRPASSSSYKKPHSPCPSAAYSPPVYHQDISPRSRSNSCNLDEITSSSKAPYIREHLTITPRRGFSVAHGGIDTLIEEEERSRSQTTTDDEAEDDELVHFNPNLLASRLQRASLQIKRIKKRKSAPMVLNEICEENEMEYNSVTSQGDDDNSSAVATDNHHQSTVSNPNVRRTPVAAVSGGGGDAASVFSRITFPSPPPQSLSKSMQRTGRVKTRGGGHRVHHHHHHNLDKFDQDHDLDWEAEEEESVTSGSSRASSANLSSVVANKLLKFRHRRDSSDDHDDEDANRRGGGGGGGSNGRRSPYASFSPLNEGCSGQDGCGEEQQTTTSNNDETTLNNNVVHHNHNSRKHHNTSAQLRSRSAELSRAVSSNYSISSSVSSCRSYSASSRTSLSTYQLMTRLSRHRSSSSRSKNSSSNCTSSDNGLMSRYGHHAISSPAISSSSTRMRHHHHNSHNLVRSTSSSSAFFITQHPHLTSSSLRVCNSVTSIRSLCDHHHQHRFSSLQMRSGKNKRHQQQQQRGHHHHHHHHGVYKQRNFTPTHHKNGGQQRDQQLASEQQLISKRSNWSLASSTCSKSKFVIDPVNEFQPPPPHDNNNNKFVNETPPPTIQHHHRGGGVESCCRLDNNISNKEGCSSSSSSSMVVATPNHHSAQYLSTILSRLGRLKAARQQNQRQQQQSTRTYLNDLTRKRRKTGGRTMSTVSEGVTHRMKHHECCLLM